MANVATGAVYSFPPEMKVELGDQIFSHMIPRSDQSDAAKEIIAALDRDETIVAVSGEVAQKLTLGARELERRTRRRGRARRS